MMLSLTMIMVLVIINLVTMEVMILVYIHWRSCQVPQFVQRVSGMLPRSEHSVCTHFRMKFSKPINTHLLRSLSYFSRWAWKSAWRAKEDLGSVRLFGPMRGRRNQGCELQDQLFLKISYSSTPIHRFINCKMLGLKGHKNAPTSDDWLLDDWHKKLALCEHRNAREAER